MKKPTILSSPDVQIVFTYAPAGLGHLRVTDALFEGLPIDADPIILPATDAFVQRMHRFSSVNPLMRLLMVWTQQGWREELFTRFYRDRLISGSQVVMHKLVEVIDQQLHKPKVLVVVATHFALAHQVAAVKKIVKDETGVEVVLIVVVTDDSPQRMWYVEGANLIFVPSETTKKSLELFAYQKQLSKTGLVVCAYPVSPILSERLNKRGYKFRMRQTNPEETSLINIAVPVSGAAVFLDYMDDLMKQMAKKEPRLRFHVISRMNVHTRSFLHKVDRRDDTTIYTARTDREVVDLYQDVYLNHRIGFEITKPSEQAFKVLYNSQQVGGSVLLLTTPVGRQEYDNLAFLRRHGLIPSERQYQYLYQRFERGADLNTQEGKEVLKEATYWRGIELPGESFESAEFFRWCFRVGVFMVMARNRGIARRFDAHRSELTSDGVAKFWEVLATMIKNIL